MAEVVGVDEFARALEDIFSDVNKVSVKALEKGAFLILLHLPNA